MIHLCAIAKNEERYVADWLEYHKKFLFDSVTIYDNGREW